MAGGSGAALPGVYAEADDCQSGARCLRRDRMTIKEKMLNAVKELQDDASVEDAMEKLLVLANIERGLVQADQSETLTQQDTKDRVGKWLA